MKCWIDQITSCIPHENTITMKYNNHHNFRWIIGMYITNAFFYVNKLCCAARTNCKNKNVAWSSVFSVSLLQEMNCSRCLNSNWAALLSLQSSLVRSSEVRKRMERLSQWKCVWKCVGVCYYQGQWMTAFLFPSPAALWSSGVSASLWGEWGAWMERELHIYHYNYTHTRLHCVKSVPSSD